MAALAGANGSGKTTLLRLICGLLRPHSGEVHIAGEKNPALRQLTGKVGYLMQDPDEQLFTESALAEVAFGPRNLSRPVDAEGELAQVGLARYRDVHPLCLSRGERQRLAAVAVLAMRPRILLLTAPTTGLDQRAWSALMELVIAMAQEQRTAVLFSTHQRDTIAAYAHRCLTLREGRVIDDRLC